MTQPRVDSSKWEEHPFFAKSIDHGISNEYIEGLKAMEEDLSLLEQAEIYKKRGNDIIKHISSVMEDPNLTDEAKAEQREKLYFSAHVWYCEAFSKVDATSDFAVTCINNRAYVQLQLGNFRNCLMDCQKVLKIDANNEKANYRAALSAKNLGMKELSLKYISKAAELNPTPAVDALFKEILVNNMK